MGAKGGTPKTMKAFVAYSKDDYRFEPEYLVPECGPDDIIIDNMIKGNLKTNGVISSIFTLEEWKKAFEYATGVHGDFKVAFKF